MIKKAANKVISAIMAKRGYAPYFATYALKKRIDDFLGFFP